MNERRRKAISDLVYDFAHNFDTNTVEPMEENLINSLEELISTEEIRIRRLALEDGYDHGYSQGFTDGSEITGQFND